MLHGYLDISPFAGIADFFDENSPVIESGGVEVVGASADTPAVQDGVNKIILLHRCKPVGRNSLGGRGDYTVTVGQKGDALKGNGL